jgi:hypothetical protein
VAQFAAASVRFLQKNVAKGSNLLFSWVGDLEVAKSLDVELMPQWRELPSHSERILPLAHAPECHLCPGN